MPTLFSILQPFLNEFPAPEKLCTKPLYHTHRVIPTNKTSENETNILENHVTANKPAYPQSVRKKASPTALMPSQHRVHLSAKHLRAQHTVLPRRSLRPRLLRNPFRAPGTTASRALILSDSGAARLADVNIPRAGRF